jgi:uncharacterized protein with GYD domain
MPTYINLINLTDQGIRHIKDAPERVREATKLYEQHGAKLTGFYLTMGSYDYVAIMEAPDDATAARLMLALAGQGNVRTTTLKAFSQDEFEKIVKTLG